MSTELFKVRVEIRAFKKGDEARVVIEEYDSWSEADKAYVAYNVLVGLKQSIVLAVDLIEVKKEVLHKSASRLRVVSL